MKNKEKKPFHVRLSDEQKKTAKEASDRFSKPIGVMIREALFDFYIPYMYEEVKKERRHELR